MGASSYRAWLRLERTGTPCVQISGEDLDIRGRTSRFHGGCDMAVRETERCGNLENGLENHP